MNPILPVVPIEDLEGAGGDAEILEIFELMAYVERTSLAYRGLAAAYGKAPQNLLSDKFPLTLHYALPTGGTARNLSTLGVSPSFVGYVGDERLHTHNLAVYLCVAISSRNYADLAEKASPWILRIDRCYKRNTSLCGRVQRAEVRSWRWIPRPYGEATMYGYEFHVAVETLNLT